MAMISGKQHDTYEEDDGTSESDVEDHLH